MEDTHQAAKKSRLAFNTMIREGAKSAASIVGGGGGGGAVATGGVAMVKMGVRAFGDVPEAGFIAGMFGVAFTFTGGMVTLVGGAGAAGALYYGGYTGLNAVKAGKEYFFPTRSASEDAHFSGHRPDEQARENDGGA